MARKKTDKERTLIINRIIELVKEQGGLVRHGRCGIFRDLRATIDFDLKRFSHNKVAA